MDGDGISMKHVVIGENFKTQPRWKIFIGVPLIYFPIVIFIPFVFLCVVVVKCHLQLMGAKNILPYRHFLPAWASHRYCYANQVTYTTGAKWHNLRANRWYWVFNCKMYCPLSVALFRYTAYLVKIVENWWCPFDHSQKIEYVDGAIDMSYWHLHEQEKSRLHPDDRNNPIWNNSSDINNDTNFKILNE